MDETGLDPSALVFGVTENEASLRLLAEYGVDDAQGYYQGRPDANIPCALLAEQAGANLRRLAHAT